MMSNLSKVSFLKLFNLRPVTPSTDSYKISEDHLTTYPSYCEKLSNKNNNIVTGYENFVIKKGTVSLFPNKDFEFVGKHVFCLKCYQKFASQISYRAHVGTSICHKNNFEPNAVYQNYKKRYAEQRKKKNKNFIEDLLHDVKKNLLNPEMLNTLQTRSNSYPDNVHKRNKVKEKPREGLNNSKNSTEKKRRGRPKKTIENSQKRRGRPKKLNIPIQSDNSSVNHIESYETKSNKSSSPIPALNSTADDENINQTTKCDQALSLVENIMVHETPRLVSLESCYTPENQNLDKHNDKLQGDKEKKLSKRIEFYLNLLKNKLRSYHNLLIDGPVVSSSINPVELDCRIRQLSEKLNKCRQSEFTAEKETENMHCCTNKTNSEADCTENKTYPDHELRNVQDIVGQCIEKKNSKDELIGDDSNMEKSHDTPNSIDNHSNANKRQLTCKSCKLNFLSVAEWKKHKSKHDIKKKYLCKNCGVRFKMYKNYIQHRKKHKIVPKINKNKKFTKMFTCQSCGKEFLFLNSYYIHVKTHIK